MTDSPETPKRTETPKTMTRRGFLRLAGALAGIVAAGCVQRQIDAYVKGQTEEAKKNPTPTKDQTPAIDAREIIEARQKEKAQAREAREAFESALEKQIKDRGLGLTIQEVKGYDGKIQIVATRGAQIRNFPEHGSLEGSVGTIQPMITINEVDYTLLIYNGDIKKYEEWVAFTKTDLAMITEVVGSPFISLNEGYEEKAFLVGERGKEKKYFFVCLSVGEDIIAKKTR
ncbi:hypothetical protein COT64_02710 [Candidatus Shapirobacteria bacterium CG09_land_8_20_14_0_10_39_12]|uniref:Uncharacterized protein n=1 Tax=Candidatus Shapirobacteria bacterium CG09_land_8_20_14_0_10_39_12 TaxID=1974885 RepID=A0A2H0WP53_9BACT|nr:MAG: hypothetical protein COT64_02710 [Candidatus Shapirobacteria bacterium CG09_land_8_20_14_0_10_39_12]